MPEVVGFGDGSFELDFACDEFVRKDFFDVYGMATAFTFVYDEKQSSDSELIFGNDYELHIELRIRGSKGDGDLPYIELRSIEGEHIIRMTFRSNPTDEMFRLEDGGAIPRLMVKTTQHVIEMTWSYEQSVYIDAKLPAKLWHIAPPKATWAVFLLHYTHKYCIIANDNK